MSEFKLPIYGLASPSADHINKELYRPIRDGSEYNALMPYSDCSSIKLADGDTKVAIDNMAIWSEKYQHHTTKLSKLFKLKDLKNTCAEIHSFLYNHFQYKIDDYNQNLRSPGCSWVSRKKGIDCKSYAIFASTILRNLGIHHYLRRIKQDVGGFTHVYVIVPKNQKKPKDLSTCFCIDGTLPFKTEPVFFEKDDVFINSINKLNSPIKDPITDALTQVGVQAIGIVWNNFAPVFDEMTKELFNMLVSCNSFDYQPKVIEHRINTQLRPKLEKYLKRLDLALGNNDVVEVKFLFNRLFKEFDLGYHHLSMLVSYGSKEKYCDKNIQYAFEYVKSLKILIDGYYNSFKTSYSEYKITEYSKSASASEHSLYFIATQSSGTEIANYRFIDIDIGEKERKFEVPPMIPYGDGFTDYNIVINDWQAEVVSYMQEKHGKIEAQNYESEIKPFVTKIRNIRPRIELGGGGVYLAEQRYQRDLYRLFIKYDKNFIEFIIKNAGEMRTANEMAMTDFKKKYDKMITNWHEIKKRKNIKKKYGFLTLTGACFMGLLIIKNTNKKTQIN